MIPRPYRPGGNNGVIRPHDVRGANASAILRLLVAEGPLSRSVISRELGLTQGAVTRIVAELSEHGLVREGERVSVTSPGRPRVPIDIAPDARLSVGIHIGVQTITAALTDLRGVEVVSRRVPHDGAVERVLEQCAQLTFDLAEEAQAPVLGVGAISGGWVEPRTGLIRRHKILNWNEVDLAGTLARRTGLPVFVEASSRAHALADLVFGEARGHRSFAHIFVGHVVEASLVLDGHVHSGPDGLGGSLENWIMDNGRGGAAPAWKVVGDGQLIQRAHAQRILPANSSFDDLVAAAHAGGRVEAKARALFDERAFNVGRLIANITDFVGLSLVIVSSGVITLDGAIEEVRRGLLHERAGMPVPELRTEANSSGILTRAAAAVVMAATVLSGTDTRDNRPAS